MKIKIYYNDLLSKAWRIILNISPAINGFFIKPINPSDMYSLGLLGDSYPLANSALISGKIAALSVISYKNGFKEFNKFIKNWNGYLL